MAAPRSRAPPLEPPKVAKRISLTHHPSQPLLLPCQSSQPTPNTPRAHHPGKSAAHSHAQSAAYPPLQTISSHPYCAQPPPPVLAKFPASAKPPARPPQPSPPSAFLPNLTSKSCASFTPDLPLRHPLPPPESVASYNTKLHLESNFFVGSLFALLVPPLGV